jgi:hypothetical protein
MKPARMPCGDRRSPSSTTGSTCAARRRRLFLSPLPVRRPQSARRGQPREDRAVGDAGTAQPGFHGAHRTGVRPAATGDPSLRPLPFLVAFGVANAQHQPLRRGVDIAAIVPVTRWASPGRRAAGDVWSAVGDDRDAHLNRQVVAQNPFPLACVTAQPGPADYGNPPSPNV